MLKSSKVDKSFFQTSGNKAIPNSTNLVQMTYIYPIIVFDIDISSFANKISQNMFTTAFLSSHVKGSQLHDRKKELQK